MEAYPKVWKALNIARNILDTLDHAGTIRARDVVDLCDEALAALEVEMWPTPENRA